MGPPELVALLASLAARSAALAQSAGVAVLWVGIRGGALCNTTIFC